MTIRLDECIHFIQHYEKWNNEAEKKITKKGMKALEAFTGVHSLGFRRARGHPVLRLVSWHFRLNLLSRVFPIKLSVFETFAMRFAICLNNFA